ncbi:MAG: hypothetical protein P8J33_02460, partial [Pirellulaceae bacterium]|nr:hypothetical protein [Pirellulaceae bacterium]
NMLKEGWDVTNLYTIIPLRTADSKTLVEQSIGRGLRLPYGTRTGVEAVDRLTIVAHERFEEIIATAEAGGYSFSTTDIPAADGGAVRTLVAKSNIDTSFQDNRNSATHSRLKALANPSVAKALESEKTQLLSKTVIAVIREEGHALCRQAGLPSVEASLESERFQTVLKAAVIGRLNTGQTELEFQGQADQIKEIVAGATSIYKELTITVPRIVVLPKGGITTGFQNFTVNTNAFQFPPVSDDLYLQHLEGGRKVVIAVEKSNIEERRLEDYVVRGLVDFPDVAYDEHADLLYGYARQVVEHFRSYLEEEAEIERVLRVHQKSIAEHVHGQMASHSWEKAVEYEAQVTQGFSELKAQAYSLAVGVQPVDFSRPVSDKMQIRQMLFTGFSRGLFDLAKFDSDTERKFALLIDSDEEVKSWVKPARGALKIYFSKDRSYEPDFVVETVSIKLLIETKARKDLGNADVQRKASAAVQWCEYATAHELQTEHGKEWKYILIPHDAVVTNTSLRALVTTYEQRGAS